MTSIGETLHNERLRRNLELDRISSDLKISPRLLEAMEVDRFDKLPGGVFTKSFVKQYARYLGLDDQEIGSSLERMLNPPSVAPEVSETRPPAVPVIALERLQGWLSENDPRFPWSSSLRALAMVVLVVLVCAAVYSWSERGPRPVQIARDIPPVAQAQQPVPAPPDKTQSLIGAETTTIVGPSGSAERLAAPVRVLLSADQPVWVQATADGKSTFSGTIEPHATQIIQANDRVFLKLGNAGGLRVELNGKPVGPLGSPGEVLRVQFTSGGFQIVPAEAPTPGAAPTEPGDSPNDPPTEPLAPL